MFSTIMPPLLEHGTYWKLWVTVAAYLSISIEAVIEHKRYIYYKENMNFEGLITEYWARSHSHCFISCSMNPSCWSYSYSDGTSLCAHFSIWPTKGEPFSLVPAPGMDLYGCEYLQISNTTNLPMFIFKSM